MSEYDTNRGRILFMFTFVVCGFGASESLLIVSRPRGCLRTPLLDTCVGRVHSFLDGREANTVTVFTARSPIILHRVPQGYICMLQSESKLHCISRPGVRAFKRGLNMLLGRMFNIGTSGDNCFDFLGSAIGGVPGRGIRRGCGGPFSGRDLSDCYVSRFKRGLNVRTETLLPCVMNRT